MAKGKRAVALFEVINAGKHVPSKPAASPPRAESWWRRIMDRARGAGPSSSLEPVVSREPAVASRAAAPDPSLTTSSTGEPVVLPSTSAQPSCASSQDAVAVSVTMESASTGESSSRGKLPSDASATPTGTNVNPSLQQDTSSESADSSFDDQPVDVRVDRERQLITLRFSYTSAAIASFAVLVVIGLSFIVGRHTSRSPSSDDPFFSAPLWADVLEVTRPGKASAPTPDAASLPDTPPTADPPAPSPATPALTSPPLGGGRIIGLNYVVVQSFADEKLARDAQQMLAQAGIETTIERGLPNYAGPTWHCVVGTRGFEASVGENHPDYARYVASIREVGRQFATRARSKEFVPQRYKWREVR